MSLADYRSKAESCQALVVGAGGIGCELLKNLVLAGFTNLVVIDLDTIDVTNLNRQFLFQRQHVGKSKSQVARESALKFNPDAKIEAIHDSITNDQYKVSFFQKFDLVMNALDNRAARSHVNRMCLAANVPLVESGTAGYLGQVTVMKKKETECYDCQPKPHQKTFPGCTIRNTPSEPIHCIVWSKHLFNQLFGESDPDQDVSPDAADPELDDGSEEKEKKADDGNVTRTSTRQWAQDCDYASESLFQKFFSEDIKYLLSMDKLWAKRKKPVPLNWQKLPEEASASEADKEKENRGIKDQQVWSIKKCAMVFEESLGKLKDRHKALKADDHLVWDKDDEDAMDFVTACANIRSHIFHIAAKSRFDIKSMAGNIIPAIATTNAVIAGAIVMEAIKLIMGQFQRCRTVYLARKPNPRKKILVPCQLNPPNPKCYVCPDQPEISIKLNVEKTSIRTLEEKILKGALHMVKPDCVVSGNSKVIISSEEGDVDEKVADMMLSEFSIKDGAILDCDDFFQDYNLKLIVFHVESLDNDAEFQIVSDISELKAKEDDSKSDATAAAAAGDSSSKPSPKVDGGEKNKNGAESKNGDGNGAAATPVAPAATAAAAPAADSDDDCIIEEDSTAAAAAAAASNTPKKRKLADKEEEEEQQQPLKKKKGEEGSGNNAEEAICID